MPPVDSVASRSQSFSLNEIKNPSGNDIEQNSEPRLSAPPSPSISQNGLNDPGIDQAINGGGQSILNGGQSASNLVAQHQVSTGKDWDFSHAKGMLEIVQQSVAHIKDTVSGKAIGQFTAEVSAALNSYIKAHPELTREQTQVLVDDLKAMLQAAGEVTAARSELVRKIPDGSDYKDPETALAAVRKGLRSFRYQTQVAANAMNSDAYNVQKMDVSEGAMRGIQNFFTGTKTVVTQEKLAQIQTLEARFEEKAGQLLQKLQTLAPDQPCPQMPENFRLSATIGDTLELCHRTNDQIRGYQDKKSTESTLRTMLEPICEKGGSHKVTLSLSASAMLGLGFAPNVVAGLNITGSWQVTADVSAPGGNKPIDVTFRLSTGLEGKLLGKAGLLFTDENLKSSLAAGGQLTGFVTRSYASLDDLILDASRNKIATSRSLPHAILGTIGSVIGKLGTKAFRRIGRHAGDTMQNNQDYLASLKSRGVVSNLDGILTGRANPVIVAHRSGLTGQVSGDFSAKFGLGDKDSSISGKLGIQHQRDWMVKGRTYAPVVQNIRNADRETLMNLRRPMPDGVSMPQMPYGATANELIEMYDLMISLCKENPPKNNVDWADFGNQLRTLMIAVEVLYLDGGISREDADRVLERCSNPEVKLPPEIYREYLMDSTGNAKPPKIRTAVSGEISFDIYTQQIKNWTKAAEDIKNPIISAAAQTGIDELRQQSGLDSKVKYSYSSEKPAHPGEDPRPWENTKKTTHQITVTGSMPGRIVFDLFARLLMRKGEQPDAPTQHSIGTIVKDSLKDLPGQEGKEILGAIPQMMIALVKENAKATVAKWAADPKKAEVLANFIKNNQDKSLDILTKAAEWAADHPNEKFETRLTAGLTVASNSISNDYTGEKVLKLDFVDGKWATIDVFQDSTSKFGINFKPWGKEDETGVSLSYAVTDSVKERGVVVNSSVTMLMGHAEQFILANTDITAQPGSNQSFKNYLTKNLPVVKKALAEINSKENINIYLKALGAAKNDLDQQIKIQDARQKLVAVTEKETSTDAEWVEATHDFIMAMTNAFRSSVKPPRSHDRGFLR